MPTRSGGESRITAAPELTPAERKALLALARAALEAHVTGGTPPALPAFEPGSAARARRGAFVTLTALDGDLRGCIGHMSADRPLGLVVRELAVAAARDDPRFAPVAKEEIGGLSIEISALGPLTRVALDADAGLVISGGVMVRRGAAVGVLLPQVAIEHGWGPHAFLQAACRKAGLDADAWREPDTDLFTFTADVFGENGERGKGQGEA